MAEKRELLKVVCRAVVLVKEGDKVLREETTQELSCYNADDLFKFWSNAEEEVKMMNPSRAARRTKT